MISDSERREVASALRGSPNDSRIPKTRYGFEGMTYHEAAFRFWNMCRRVRDVSNVDIAYSTTSVLADLIDRQTCEMKGDPWAKYGRCSHCGAFVRRDAVTNCIGVISARYCPNCGAMVVDADD